MKNNKARNIEKGSRINYVDLGSRLSEIREETKLNQKDFYIKYLRAYDPEPCSNTTAQSRVSDYEYGYRVPCGDLLLRYAEISGKNIHELLTGENESASYGNALKRLAELSDRGIISISEEGTEISVNDMALQKLLSQLRYQKKHTLSDKYLYWLSETINRFKEYDLAKNIADVQVINNHIQSNIQQFDNEELGILYAILNMHNDILRISKKEGDSIE